MFTLQTFAPKVDGRYVLDPFEPAYLSLAREEIAARVAAGLKELEDCCACPRDCHVNRLANETRVCNTGRFARVASAFPHRGEEDCLRGWNGSGTIFFSLCNLRCVFCQNWDISQRSVGDECPPERIADRTTASWSRPTRRRAKPGFGGSTSAGCDNGARAVALSSRQNGIVADDLRGV